MALTPEVKAELAAVPVTKPACRKAEVAALLRFAGSLHIQHIFFILFKYRNPHFRMRFCQAHRT